jgi:hypothetical protein
MKVFCRIDIGVLISLIVGSDFYKSGVAIF